MIQKSSFTNITKFPAGSIAAFFGLFSLETIVSLSLFLTPFLLVKIESDAIIIWQILKSYAILAILFFSWALLIWSVREIINSRRELTIKFKKTISILKYFSLLVCTGFSLYALNYAREIYSPNLFSASVICLGFWSLENAFEIRKRAALEHISRLSFFCSAGFLVFLIFYSELHWQLLLFHAAFALQAFTVSLSRQFCLSAGKKTLTENDFVSRKLLTRIFGISLFAGPLAIGLLAILHQISAGYILSYAVFPFSSMLFRKIQSAENSDTFGDEIVKEAFFLYSLLYCLAAIVRLIS